MSKKLLLADDSITIQKVIGITFANEDYELTVVDNGDAALEKARSEKPDLILADVFMPGKNGYELCAAVRQEPSLVGVPLLLLTGTFEPFDENKARASGADSWIAKPFESQTLIDRVEELLARQPQAMPAAVEEPAAPALPQAHEAPAVPAPGEAPDIWGDLAESEDAETGAVQASEPAAEGFALAETSAEELKAPPAIEDDDLWGDVSFGDEDLLTEEPLGGSLDDIWGTIDEAETASGALPIAGEESFLLEDEPPAEVTTASVAGAPPAMEEFIFEEEEATAPIATDEPQALDEEDILPLDDFDILDEEELAGEETVESGEDFIFADAGEGAAVEEPAGEIDFGELPAFEEEEKLVSEIEPSALEDEYAITEEGPEWGIAEGNRTVTFELEPMPAANDFLITPAEAAHEPPPAPAAASIAAVEARAAALSEEELTQIVERVAGAVIERLAGSILEKIAWEVVPDLAESLVREEIRKIKEGAQ